MAPRVCKDCTAELDPALRDTETGRRKAARRPAPHAGPRCATHHRIEKQRRRKVAHGRRTEDVYGITEAQYDELYAMQGGRCYICRRATGKRKRLAVDHDHRTGEVRGLLCGPCNKDLLGRYGVAALRRAITYLRYPPARALLDTVHPHPWPDLPMPQGDPYE